MNAQNKNTPQTSEMANPVVEIFRLPDSEALQNAQPNLVRPPPITSDVVNGADKWQRVREADKYVK